MSSMSGFINYLTYTAGSNKGETSRGEVFNSPLALGKVDPNYTSSKVVEAVTAGEAFAPAWTPVEGTVRFFVNGAWTDAEAVPETVPANATKVAYEYDNVHIPQNDIPLLNAKMESVDLHAKARRIAIYYSQIAAYQA